MKRTITILLLSAVLLSILIATGCARREPVGTVDASLKKIIVTIPDDNLEEAIRNAINKPTKEITA